VLALALWPSGSRDVLGRYSPGHAALLGAAFLAADLVLLGWLPPVAARLERRVAPALLALASLGLAVGAAELAVRALDLRGISYYTEMARYVASRVPDPELVYRQPSSATLHLQGVEVRTNELGLRDDPVAAKAPGELRVLVLGDSVAFGWGVAQEAIFPSVLQRLLAERLARPVRVVNSGVCSYNTVQELAFLRTRGLALEPDVVILFYVANDVGTHEAFEAPPAWRELPPPALLRRALGALWLYRLADHALRYGLAGTRAPRSEPSAQPGAPGWQASMDALRALEAHAREAGFRLLVFFGRWTPDPASTPLLDAVREAVAPAPVADTAEWFAGRALRPYLNSVVDAHPNAAAHRVFAEHMAEAVRAALAPEAR
jgi:lysophospholipase L1-like esterase